MSALVPFAVACIVAASALCLAGTIGLTQGALQDWRGGRRRLALHKAMWAGADAGIAIGALWLAGWTMGG